MRIINQKEFKQEDYIEGKFYGSFGTGKSDYLVGPFESDEKALNWLKQEYETYKPGILDDFFVVDDKYLKEVIEANKPKANFWKFLK